MEEKLMTAQEAADFLKIKKTTVYELIRRGELPSARVGKQVRVAMADMEAYLNRSKRGASSEKGADHGTFRPYETAPAGDALVLSGQDGCLELLVNRLAGTAPVLRSFIGCHSGLIELYHGRVSMAASHLWDMETDSYNLPYVTRLLPGVPVGLVRLAGRMQGFYVKSGNPKGIRGWEDLRRGDISIINRETGCGTRALLDQKIKAMGIAGGDIDGYDRQAASHLAVAGAVAMGAADLGCGCAHEAARVIGVAFVPLQPEWYDLVYRLADRERPAVSTILQYVTSPEFRRDMEVLGGYDLSQTGRTVET